MGALSSSPSAVAQPCDDNVRPPKRVSATFASANIHHAIDDQGKPGSKGAVFCAHLRQQLEDEHLHVIGIQEVLPRTADTFVSQTHVRVCSGHHGGARRGDVEILISRT